MQCAEGRSGRRRRRRRRGNTSGLFEEVTRWLGSHRLPTRRPAGEAGLGEDLIEPDRGFSSAKEVVV